MSKGDTRSAKILGEVGRELKKNPPKILDSTRANKGSEAADRQRVAILLSKARKRGAKIPR